jgi:hypothetical protein
MHTAQATRGHVLGPRAAFGHGLNRQGKYRHADEQLHVFHNASHGQATGQEDEGTQDLPYTHSWISLTESMPGARGAVCRRAKIILTTIPIGAHEVQSSAMQLSLAVLHVMAPTTNITKDTRPRMPFVTNQPATQATVGE